MGVGDERAEKGLRRSYVRVSSGLALGGGFLLWPLVLPLPVVVEDCPCQWLKDLLECPQLSRGPFCARPISLQYWPCSVAFHPIFFPTGRNQSSKFYWASQDLVPESQAPDMNPGS